MVGRRLTLIFDASALIAFLKNEPGAAVVEALLANVAALRLVHAVNLCEVYYHFVRLNDEARMTSELAALQRGGLVTRRDISVPFWREVARIKADVQRVSLGDSFAIALAQAVGGEVVTADHGEFDFVATRGICAVRFIR